MMDAHFDKEPTIPHVTRNDGIKTGLYALVGLALAASFIAGTIWLFIAG